MIEAFQLAAQKYSALRGSISANPLPQNTSSPLQDFATTLKQGEVAATSALTTNVDPHAYVKALAQTELAVEAAVTVRDKVVEAYQEILRMPV